MRKRFIPIAGIIFALTGLVAVSPAIASVQAPAAHLTRAAATAPALTDRAAAAQAAQAIRLAGLPDSGFNCPQIRPMVGSFCDYAGTSGASICWHGAGSSSNWANEGSGCRNVDESMINQGPGDVRLYFGTGGTGAHFCLAKGTTRHNMAGITFSDGSGAGLNAHVKDNIASSVSALAGSCTHPIPSN